MEADATALAVDNIPSDSNVGTCHTEDYIRCALVIAGCAATCSGDSSYYNRMVKCVIAEHHQDCVDCIRNENQGLFYEQKQSMQNT